MTSWQLEYSAGLEDRIDEIVSFVANDLGDVFGAQKILSNLRKTFTKIGETPYRYRLHPIVELEQQGVRVAVTGSYHILFTVLENKHIVRIVDILHGFQNVSAEPYY